MKLDPYLTPYTKNQFQIDSRLTWHFPGNLVVKNSPANAGDMGLIPNLGQFHKLGAAKTTCHSYGSPHALKPILSNKRGPCCN